MHRAFAVALSVAALAVLVVRPASATFHLMQIEQVIGGVDGNTGVQAIQLRMRSTFQNQMQNARLIAHDAAGLNPVLLIAFPTAAGVQGTGVRVLAATANFSSFTNPAIAPDYVLTNPIPPSYLAAGSITFEDNFGTIYWRLSWGGASYAGTGAGDLTNDGDGNFSPPFPLALPSLGGRGLLFTGAAGALSTSNDAQYVVTAGAATFTKNNGTSAQIKSTVGVGEGDVAGIELGRPIPNPSSNAVSYSVTLPRPAHVRVRAFDLGGRTIGNLVDRDLPAGRQSFTWDILSDTPGLASGVVMLVMDSEGRRLVRRFTFLRGAPLREGHLDH